MKINFEDFKIFCITPGYPDSNKANSYVNAIQIVFDYLNIQADIFELSDYEEIQNLHSALNDKNCSVYLDLHDFVINRKQKSYLEGGFINAAINYFNDYYTRKKR